MSVRCFRSFDLVENPRRSAVFAVGSALVVSAGVLLGNGVASSISTNDASAASRIAEDLARLELQIAYLQRELVQARRENTRVGDELAALTHKDGVLEVLIEHLRRIDGEGRALRIELGALFSDPAPLAAPEPAIPLQVPGARHQIVSRAAELTPPEATKSPERTADDEAEE